MGMGTGGQQASTPQHSRDPALNDLHPSPLTPPKAAQVFQASLRPTICFMVPSLHG